ncbi:hypothetical protein AB1Y20_013331 [Prymnesium parvum]|uniref:Uncharacterized protein n=1 Tax=Prymnesium parvum TaxID=97485 RepID=A0AB34IMI0_PRYPA
MGCGCSRAAPPHESAPDPAPPRPPPADSAPIRPPRPRAPSDPDSPLGRALLLQRSRLQAALAVDAEAQARVSHVWAEYGGRRVEEALDCVSLVDGRFYADVAEFGGAPPRWEELPREGMITAETLLGEQMRRVAPLLRAVLAEYEEGASAANPHARHGTIGVMQDFCSLPQDNRTHDGVLRFQRGLLSMNMWYTHPWIPVLKLTTPLPSARRYTNRLPYERRGWCFFEAQASGIAKGSTALWDIAHFRGAKDLMQVIRQCQSGRKPPMSPDVFRAAMESAIADGRLKFTVMRDAYTVVELYRIGFVTIFERAYEFQAKGSINYNGLDWTSDDLLVFQEAMAYVGRHCKLQRIPDICWAGAGTFSEVSEARVYRVLASWNAHPGPKHALSEKRDGRDSSSSSVSTTGERAEAQAIRRQLTI